MVPASAGARLIRLSVSIFNSGHQGVGGKVEENDHKTQRLY